MSTNSLPLQGRRILLAEPGYLLAMDSCATLRQNGAEVLGPVPREEQAHALLDRRDVEATLFSAWLINAESLANRLSGWCLPPLLLSLDALPMEHRFRGGRSQLLLPCSKAQLHEEASAVLPP